MNSSTQQVRGWINVVKYDSKTIEEGLGTPISEVSVREEFNGGLAGVGTASFFTVTGPDGSMHFAGMERFTGKLGTRSGSFLFQNSGELTEGGLRSRWLVIPGSATGELGGLHGTGGCSSGEGYFFDYWFE